MMVMISLEQLLVETAAWSKWAKLWRLNPAK